LGLIVAIGAQNAFVLRQGLRRRFLLPVALTCALCDAVLIAVGAGGFGSLVRVFPAATRVAAWAGALFLFAYGFRSLRAAVKPAATGLDTDTKGDGPATARQAVLTTLGFSLLNPHVYLDTIALLGGVASQYGGARRAVFAVGAMVASLTWFFALAFGAARLAPFFRKPSAWRVLDALTGALLWLLAASLLWNDFAQR